MTLYIIREGLGKQEFMIQSLHRITMVRENKIILKEKQKHQSPAVSRQYFEDLDLDFVQGCQIPHSDLSAPMTRSNILVTEILFS